MKFRFYSSWKTAKTLTSDHSALMCCNTIGLMMLKMIIKKQSKHRGTDLWGEAQSILKSR